MKSKKRISILQRIFVFWAESKYSLYEPDFVVLFAQRHNWLIQGVSIKSIMLQIRHKIISTSLLNYLLVCQCFTLLTGLLSSPHYSFGQSPLVSSNNWTPIRSTFLVSTLPSPFTGDIVLLPVILFIETLCMSFTNQS